jgi:hypothetical protein
VTFRKPIITAVLCATAVAGVSVAEAAISGGTFAGRTGAKDPVGFRVDGSSRVYGFYFEGVRLKCSDGDHFTTSRGAKKRSHSPTKARYKINSSRRFTIFRPRSTNGLGWTFKGRFSSKGGSASGTLRVLARFDIENHLKPNGSVKCDSGVLNWTARRR